MEEEATYTYRAEPISKERVLLVYHNQVQIYESVLYQSFKLLKDTFGDKFLEQINFEKTGMTQKSAEYLYELWEYQNTENGTIEL